MDINHADRAHALLSASGSDIWFHCPASAMLAARYPRIDTKYTLEGTAAHEVAEVSARRTVLGADLPLPEGEQYDAEMVKHGQAYADYIAGLCKPETMVLLERRVDFSPWVQDGFGTADCILLNGSVMDVIDFKYGTGVPVSAENNTQMQLYGLGAINMYGFVFETEKVRLHIFQPRIDNISVWELSADELMKFGEYARDRSVAAMEEDPEMSAGSHCKWCKHAGRCPELARTCISKVAVGDTLAPDPKTLTPGAISFVLGIESMVSSWLKAVKTTAQAELLEGREIPGYKVVEGKLGNREWTDELKVSEALKAAGIPEEDFTVRQVLSPAKMDAALGKKKAAELLGKFISRAPGKPTVVPASDKRSDFDVSADFKNLEE